MTEKLKDISHGIIGTVIPAGGVALSFSGVEQFLRVAGLLLTCVSSVIWIYFFVKKNR